MTAPSLTPLSLAALGLLREKPRHPYEMYQTLVFRGEDRIVKVRPGTLYHSVARLAEQGFVEEDGVERDGNRPERTVYRITLAGVEALGAALEEMLGESGTTFPPFPLALAEAHSLPAGRVVEKLGNRIQGLHERLAEYELLRNAALEREVPRAFWIVVEYQQHLLEAEADWLSGLVEEIRTGSLDINPCTQAHSAGTGTPVA
ncbi:MULTISPECIES: PadR family transcriptional regulator [Arthrobacter]|uniref:PadR family transcriptional regulator n=2 Tax=Arthrobacter TaxID=1663 RepID=A0ABU9KQ33_9MICC|nr:PadR family transcriptional regulator [Arthrobacter sp. YJM1]MDP5227911.1 PadR family transcriptional regulator [Arthrobacter sp. YJM1]